MNEEITLYNLSLEGNGITVCKQIDEDQARRILNILMGSSLGFQTTEKQKDQIFNKEYQKSESHIISLFPQELSLREYLDEVGAQRNPDKILAIASYILESSSSENFSADEIKNYFPKAAEKIPANYTRDFRWVIANGWIAEHHQNTGYFYITAKGRQALAGKFPKELSKPQPGYIKKRKQSSNEQGEK